jgi:hypothetical protein
MAEYGIETSAITHQEKVQKPTICWKTDACSFLGLTTTGTGILSREGEQQ